MQTLSTKPTNKLVYLTFMVIGASYLWPWNCFLSAISYFYTRIYDDHLRSILSSSLMTISTITSTLVFLYLADKQRFANYPRRIVYGEIITAIVFLFLALSCFVKLSGDVTYFGFLLFAMFMATVGTSYTQNGSIAVVSLYEPVYTQAVMVGQALAGIVPPLGSILSALSYESGNGTTADSTSTPDSDNSPAELDSSSSWAQWSSFTYFIVATVLSLSAVFLYIFSINKVKVLHEPDEGDYLKYQDELSDDQFENTDIIESQEESAASSSEYTSFLSSPNSKPKNPKPSPPSSPILAGGRPHLQRSQTHPIAIVEDEEALVKGEHHTSVSLTKLFMKLRVPATSIFLVFAVTLAYPVFASTVQSNTFGIPDHIYIPIVFFVWNFGDLIGRVLCAFPCFIIKRDSYFLIYGIGRLLFIPFFLLFTMSKNRSDIAYLLLHLLFGITNGHLCSCCFIQFPNYLDETEREAGGGFMTLILSFGLTTGSLFSFVLSILVNTISKNIRNEQFKSSLAGSNANLKLRPLVVGISGPQGLGKSTLAAALQTALEAPQNGNLNVQRFSLDDVYLTHHDQQALSANSNGNPLLRTRGQPGTHDLDLCVKVFDALCGAAGRNVKVPVYDKAAFGGEGDREFEGQIPEPSDSNEATGYLDVVIFEGWCVGFQSLTAEELDSGIRERLLGSARGSNKLFDLLAQHREYLTSVNEYLAAYQAVWDYFDVFVHLDAGDIGWVYDWRLEQEHKLIAERGTGQSDDQVCEFINGYMSSYYLYVPRLRACNARGPLVGKRVQAHMRLVVDKNRDISHIITSEADRERL